ncbi:MAG: methylated-DNA--[protein]-cysteine S-methyltransferase [Rhodospirillales bacterium]|nr:methylated-DNA--[protein]-cysteine S-methyltransferase [Rhodospirillales bacterium]
MKLIFDTFDTPLGEMTAVAQGDALCLLDFSDCPVRIEKLLRRFGTYEKSTKANPLNIQTRVLAYFKGERDAFAGLKLDTGGTAFQQSVWRALRKIPHGGTLSYRELAQNIDKPKAQRAVGNANGRNPIAIIIPCHRVIASNGTLAGYAGGVARKAHLLSLEANH